MDDVARTRAPACRAASSSSRDEVRRRWTLLAPERIFEVDATAAAMLQLCDGERDLAAIVADLAARYNAPTAVIEKDVVAMLERPQGQEGAGHMTAHSPHAPRAADRRPGRTDPSLPARLSALLEPARARAPRDRTRHGDVEARVRRGRRARRAACPSFGRRADRAARHRRNHPARRARRALHQPHHLGRRGQREACGAGWSKRASTMRSFRSRERTRRPTTASAITTAPGRRSAPSPRW